MDWSGLGMEMEENLEEMFDFNAMIPPESVYSSVCVTTNPSTSSSSSAAPKLISFESNNVVSAAHDNCPNDDDEMANNNNDFKSFATSQILNFSTWENDSNDATVISQTRVATGGTVNRTVSQARDHLMAERKRRQNLGQLFISLSKVVPGLKKLDKASLLEDAINYLKALQERVGELEEGMNKKGFTSKDHISSNKLEVFANNNDNENCSRSTASERAVAEIKVRISDDHVLVKAHCKKQMGLMCRVPSHMEKLHLSVVDMRVLPFGEELLVITLLAKMQSGFGGTVKDIVEHLHTIFFSPRQDEDLSPI